MRTPQLIYDEGVMQTLLSLRSAERTLVLRALKQLKNSYTEDEAMSALTDSTGRRLSLLTVKPFVIVYWLDSPVNELRIVDLQRIRF